MAINLDPKRTNITWFGGETKIISQTYSANNPIEFLTYLNSKMDLVVREWDYWDVYKFESSVNNGEDLTSAIAGLTPNHSLVINTTFAREDDTYNRGDVILKKENGDIIHIPSKSPGIFYPFSLHNESGVYKLVYKYATNLDELPTTGQEIKYDPEDYSSLPIEIQGSASSAYSIKENFVNLGSTYTFTALTNINPIIKAFIGNDIAAEEININYKLTLNNNQYTINFLDLESFIGSNSTQSGFIIIK